MQRHVDLAKGADQPGTRVAGWSVQHLPGAFGTCWTQRFANGRGMRLALTRYAPVHDFVEESHQTERARTLTITLALDGDSGYTGTGGTSLRFRRGFTTVAASRATVGERHFSAHSPVVQLRIAVDESELAHYVGADRADALLGEKQLQELAFHPTASGCLGHARALVRLARSTSADPLALHLHMLGVLHEEARRLAPARDEPARCLPDAEAARIERAYHLMTERMDQPMSVACLAAAVGLSTFKLRQGFHALCGRSPQEVMQGLRMQRALALLESGLQVATVAYRVGYGHPANFSAAFSRYHGRPPKSIPTRPAGRRTDAP